MEEASSVNRVGSIGALESRDHRVERPADCEQFQELPHAGKVEEGPLEYRIPDGTLSYYVTIHKQTQGELGGYFSVFEA